MRSTFIETLTELAQKDKRLMLLTADLGYTVLEHFSEKNPAQYFNVGVAEQNMVGIGTGLSAAGFIPFLYSIVNFTALRPYEFIRNGPILHQLPIRIVGVGGGFDYGSAGVTHYGLEDVAVMRTQLGMTVVVPADAPQAKKALLKTWDLPGPVYYRIGKGDKDPVEGLDGKFDLDKVNQVKDGKECAIVCMGGVAKEAIKAAKQLSQEGTECAVIIVSSFNSSSEKDLAKQLANFSFIVAVEDHYINGGLGSFVSEVVAENNLSSRVIRCGVKVIMDGITGSKAFMYEKHGLSTNHLVQTIQKNLINK